MEGIDGSGKSTILKSLVKRLNDLGHKAVGTQEPTHSKLGKILRDYLSNPNSVPESDALLFAADRVEHYHELIKPKIEQGFIVVCDRYKHSSLVYQGSQGVEFNWIKEINRKAEDPDIVIFLEISIETALSRVESSNRSNIEKFENVTYLNRITESYKQFLGEENVFTINAELPIKTIVDEIIEIIKTNFLQT